MPCRCPTHIVAAVQAVGVAHDHHFALAAGGNAECCIVSRHACTLAGNVCEVRHVQVAACWEGGNVGAVCDLQNTRHMLVSTLQQVQPQQVMAKA